MFFFFLCHWTWRLGFEQGLHNMIHITTHGPWYNTDITKINTVINCRIDFLITALTLAIALYQVYHKFKEIKCRNFPKTKQCLHYRCVTSLGGRQPLGSGVWPLLNNSTRSGLTLQPGYLFLLHLLLCLSHELQVFLLRHAQQKDNNGEDEASASTEFTQSGIIAPFCSLVRRCGCIYSCFSTNQCNQPEITVKFLTS